MEIRRTSRGEVPYLFYHVIHWAKEDGQAGISEFNRLRFSRYVYLQDKSVFGVKIEVGVYRWRRGRDTQSDTKMGSDPRCSRRFGIYLFIGAVLLATLAHDKTYVCAQVSVDKGVIIKIIFCMDWREWNDILFYVTKMFNSFSAG